MDGLGFMVRWESLWRERHRGMRPGRVARKYLARESEDASEMRNWAYIAYCAACADGDEGLIEESWERYCRWIPRKGGA